MKEKILKTKKVTIDDLAVMVAKGFESVYKEIVEVKEKLGMVEDRLGNVEEKLGKVEENLNTTRMDVLGIGDNSESADSRLGRKLNADFNQHLIRFDLLEQKVKAKK